MQSEQDATHEDLGRALAEMIDQLESQRVFAGDLEGTFVVPLSGGAEYRVTVLREQNWTEYPLGVVGGPSNGNH